MEEPNFWDNPEEAQEQMKQLSSMKEDRDTYQKLVSAKEDMETLIEMGQEEDDASVVPEIAELMEEFKASFEAIRIKTLLSGEFDKDNAIIKLNAGAGGTEACDWCGMLYRMYTRWAERKGFTIEELDFLDGDEAGVKSVTFQVNGENAYGYLKSEKGVHRLVRISPFNAAGKRQTSFVSCDVMPDIEDEIDIEILEMHDQWKKDAPSGTSKEMGEIMAHALGKELSNIAVYGREGESPREPGTIGYHSLRAGNIPSSHTVFFGGMGERLEITHHSYNWECFARGACDCAAYLDGKAPGFYSIKDVLGL